MKTELRKWKYFIKYLNEWMFYVLHSFGMLLLIKKLFLVFFLNFSYNDKNSFFICKYFFFFVLFSFKVL